MVLGAEHQSAVLAVLVGAQQAAAGAVGGCEFSLAASFAVFAATLDVWAGAFEETGDKAAGAALPGVNGVVLPAAQGPGAAGETVHA